VPLDLETLRQARGKDSLIAMKGCVPYKGGTRSADAARDFRWGAETLISWVAPKLFEGKSVELIQVMDISSCNPDTLRVIDDFPGTRFRPDGYMSNPAIPDFDWDGDKLFLMNTAIRNEGWGDLYTYNMDLRKANKVNPIDGKCCYRDARWSPDKSHIFFAFQDFNLGAQTVTQFYYIPVNALNSNAEFSPIPLPEAFFKNLKEAPQPALHLVSP